MFWSNLTLTLGFVLLFAACGWWAVAPFRRQFAFALAQAPLAGMLLLSMGVLALVVVLLVPFDRALLVAALLLAGGSVASIVLDREGLSRYAGFVASMVLAASIASVWFMTRSDIYFGVPALSYAHGTDHLGYAIVADWLRGRPMFALDPNPTDWYGSFPDMVVKTDARFGSFALLGIVSELSGRPGAFSYDLCSAIAIAAGVLAVAAVFARRRSTFLLVVFALFTGYWFDWNRAGYLGKTLGYPAGLFVVGLVVSWIDQARRGRTAGVFEIAVLQALTAGASLMFTGLVTAMLIVMVGGAYTSWVAWVRWRRDEPLVGRPLVDSLVLVALLAAFAILSSGMIARPLLAPGNLPVPWTWWDVLSRAAELEGLMPNRTLLSRSAITIVSTATLAAGLVLLALALRARSYAAASLIGAPLVMLAILVPPGFKWHAMNFFGLYVGLLLCGSALLMDDGAATRLTRTWRSILTVLVLAIVVWRLPRFAATAKLHGGRDIPAHFRFSSAETDALAAAITREGGSALVDLDGPPQLPIFLMVELGRRKVSLQWSEASWRQTVGYRRWPVPRYDKPAPLRILARSPKTSGPALLQTTQFELVRQ